LSVLNRILQKNQFQMQSKQFHNFRNVIQPPLLRNSILQRRNVVPQPRNVIMKEEVPGLWSRVLRLLNRVLQLRYRIHQLWNAIIYQRNRLAKIPALVG
jgi:hypothetical protein